MLCSQYFTVKINQGGDMVVNCRRCFEFNSSFFIIVNDVGIDGVPIFGGFLLNNSCLFDGLYKLNSTSIHDGHFRSVYFNQAVVDSHAYECGEDMFNCADSGTV